MSTQSWVQGVEVLSKNSFNVQHVYTITRNHTGSFVDTFWHAFKFALFSCTCFTFWGTRSSKPQQTGASEPRRTAAHIDLAVQRFIVGKLAMRIKLCSFFGSGYGSILPSKKIESYESWQQLSWHEDYPNRWLQERSAIIGHKSTTGGVANIAARLAEMYLAWKLAVDWSVDWKLASLCTLIWGFPKSRKTQSRQMNLNEIEKHGHVDLATCSKCTKLYALQPLWNFLPFCKWSFGRGSTKSNLLDLLLP